MKSRNDAPGLRASQPIPPTLLWFLAVILAALAGAWTVHGAYRLLRVDGFDLRHRWIDEQYFYHRQNPYDVLFAADAIESRAPAAAISRDASIDQNLGRPIGGGYPPWSFFSGIVLTGLPWPVMPYAFLIYNLLALTLIAFYAWDESRACPAAGRLFLSMAILAIAGNFPALAWGQYGIIVVAFLAAAAMLEKRGLHFLAGLALGIALLKPNISVPFCLCFVFQRRYRVLLAAGIYLVIASVTVWIVTRVNPFEMCQQMLTAGQHVVADIPGPLHWVVLVHIPIQRAIPLLAGSILALACLAMFYFRRDSLLIQYAIASVAARLWTYHRPDDNIMLAPLLLALGIAMLACPRWRAIACFFLAGLALWIPFTYHNKELIILIQCTIWSAALVILLTARPPVTAGIVEVHQA